MKNITKFILLVFLILLLVGCQKDYTLVVSDNEIVEKFDITAPNNKENEELAQLNYYPLHANDEIVYTKDIKKEGKNLKVHLEYTYNPEDFSNANSINECFNDKEIIVDNDEYYLFKLGNVNNCMSEYDVNLNIVTNNEVLENNADKVKGNKYTWYLNDSNREKFNLEIKIAKGKIEKKISKNMLVVGIIIVLVVFVGAIYIFIKRKKSNDI